MELAVVTGASGGIGREIAVSVSPLSDVTFLIGRDIDRLNETAGSCDGRAEVVVADVTAPDSMQSALRLVGETGVTNLLIVAAAGVIGPICAPGDETQEEWIETIETNLIGAYMTVHPFLPLLKTNSWARIVMVSSAQSLHGPDPVMSAYATSKIALNAYAGSLAMQFEGTDVSVCAIHPGDVFTAMGEEIEEKASAAGPNAAHLADWARHVAGKGDDPREAADLIRLIVRNPASWSNGRFLLTASGGIRHPDAGWSMPVGPSE